MSGIMMKRITIFGSTGSIGTQTLSVAEQFPNQIKIVGLCAGRNLRLLSQQIKQWNPSYVVVSQEEDALELQRQFPAVEVSWGEDARKELARIPVDTVVMALIGFVGLLPIVEALKEGQRVALANKEPIIAAGALFEGLIREYGGQIFPVDSEHSAIFQALHGSLAEVEKVILTASGGPFYHTPMKDLSLVTVAEAINHPKWKMGKKLSVDSATLMNKGLEVIEARWLFQLEPDQLEVVIHPQSIVHGMVQYIDGSLMAHMGFPDMRMPITYAISYPQRWPLSLPRLNWREISGLQFESPDYDRFPALKNALEVNRQGGILPAVMSAANEIAVESFLSGMIRFDEIISIVLQVLENTVQKPVTDVNSVLEADFRARHQARKLILLDSGK
jgi:1-deoxy-D-xylulose-5-phosphate reductoisomerase